MRRCFLVPSHPPADLEHCYRRALDPVARSHGQIVWLLTRGEPTTTVVHVTG